MRTPCGASSGFQWTFLHFVCSKALTLPAEVWWLAEPFVPAEAPLVQRGAAAHAASSRGGRNSRTVGSQATRLCTFMCLILAFFLFYTCSCAHACMMFTAYFSFCHCFSFFYITLTDFCGSESEPLPTADAIEHCVAYRAVEDAVYKRNLVLINCLLFLFFFFVVLSCVFEYHIYFNIAPFRLSAPSLPNFMWPSYPVS